ncbi:MAG TPA: hypothetical protein VM925_02825 [Labilithrix sp.]|nr:hypothetical protein [Labilithrix sp.]
MIVVTAGAALVLQPSCRPITSEAEGGRAPSSAEITYYTNPGDARVASIVVEGRPITYFGSKDGAGIVQHIHRVIVDSADRDPAKRAIYGFAPNGNPTTVALASGEAILLSWTGLARAILTYRSADGQSESRGAYDFSSAPVSGRPKVATERSSRVAARRTALERAAPEQKSDSAGTGSLVAVDDGGRSNPGVVDVQCGDGSPISEVSVTGHVVPANVVDEKSDLAFTESRPGHFDYSLPIAPAPNARVSTFRSGLSRALGVLCTGTLTQFGETTNHSVCLAMLGAPAAGTAAFAACRASFAAYGLVCRTNVLLTGGGIAKESTSDLWATEYEVTAVARHARLGQREVKLTARAGQPIPPAVTQYTGAAAISRLTTLPIDPEVEDDYVVEAATLCASDGYTLMLSMRGSDEHAAALPEPVPLSATVREATLSVPGAIRSGVTDKITAVLSGPTSDRRETSIVF